MSQTSGILSTNTRERVKALLITVIGAIATTIGQAIYDLIVSGGKIPTTWAELVPVIMVGIKTGIAAGFLYFGVTLGTNGTKPNAIEKLVKKDNTLT